MASRTKAMVDKQEINNLAIELIILCRSGEHLPSFEQCQEIVKIAAEITKRAEYLLSFTNPPDES